MAAEWGKHRERHYHIITADAACMSAVEWKPCWTEDGTEIHKVQSDDTSLP